MVAPADLRDLSPTEIEALVAELGGTPAQAAIAARAVLRQGVENAGGIPVAKSLRDALSHHCFISRLAIVDRRASADGTEKFLYRLPDGETVEGVLIPDEKRLTLCVSTQVGCRSGCRFCLTAAGGFVRNLSAAEMLGQVLAARAHAGRPVTNLVLMGSGEPLDNFNNVKRFVAMVTHRYGLNLSPRRITLSTSGLVPAIKKMAGELDVSLAVSLNATDDETRSRLMPINRVFPLADLMSAIREHCSTGRRVLIEYVLLKGENDSDRDAERLVSMLSGLPVMVNILSFNPYPDSPYSPPSEEEVRRFQKKILDGGIVSVVRESRGGDILAACGQLRAGAAGRTRS